MYAYVVLQAMQRHLRLLLQLAAQGSCTRYELLVHLMYLRLVAQLLMLSSMTHGRLPLYVLDRPNSQPVILTGLMFDESYRRGILHTALEQQMRSQRLYRT